MISTNSLAKCVQRLWSSVSSSITEQIGLYFLQSAKISDKMPDEPEGTDMYIHLRKEDSEKLDRLMREYEQTFHEGRHAYCMRDPIAEIEKYLKTGKPSKIKPEPGAVY